MLTTPHIHDKKLILYFHEIDIKNNKINFLSASGNQKDKATINMFSLYFPLLSTLYFIVVTYENIYPFILTYNINIILPF